MTGRLIGRFLAVFSQSSPEVAKANVDLSKTYTNRFVEKALGAGH